MSRLPRDFAVTEMLAHMAVAGQIFRRLRCEMSQEAFADKALITQSTLSRFENGETSPDLYELHRIATATHRSATEVIAMIDKAFKLAAGIAHKLHRARAWDMVALNDVSSLAELGVSALDQAEPGVFNPIRARTIRKPDRRKRPRRQDDTTKARIRRSKNA